MPAAVVKDGTVTPKFRQGKISPPFLTAKFSPRNSPLAKFSPPLYTHASSWRLDGDHALFTNFWPQQHCVKMGNKWYV